MSPKTGGKSPLFFPLNTNREADHAAHFTPPPITVTTTNVIDNHVTVNSNAQALASGGDGGAATVTIDKDAMKAESRIESGAVNQSQSVTVQSDAAETAKIVLEAVKLGRELAGERPAPAIPLTSSNGEVVPPEGGMTTRGIIARKLNRTTATLRGWERDGVAPGGIPWPKGIVTVHIYSPHISESA